MTTTNTCPECGRELTDNIEGLCPACLLAQGMLSMGDSIVSSDAPFGEMSDEDVAAIPETPGRYTILGEHAKGGMGRVLLVHDETLGRDVALKELLPEYVEDTNGTPTPVRHSKEMAARFLREARITGQLEHPSITPVHELGRRPDGTLYYTMKLVKGRTLSRAIKDCKTLEERLKLLPHFVDLCNAIAYAHSRGVIHRDIKPQNVMVGDYGETVILDWGLAKATARPFVASGSNAPTVLNVRSVPRGSGVQTRYGEILGTPVYMSPEQASGRLDEVDERSDVYSLGVILFQILSGELPFSSGSIETILASVRHDEPPEISTIEPEAPPELNDICTRAMKKLRSLRYQSAQELGNDVYRYQSVIEADLAIRESNQRLADANRKLDRARAREQQLREEAQATAYRAKIRVAQSCLDKDQAYRTSDVLSRLPRERRNWEWYYLNGLCDRGEFTVDTGSRTTTLAVSRDGKRILVGSWDGVLRMYDAETGQLMRSAEEQNSCIWSVAWNSDQEVAVSGGQDSRLRFWNTHDLSVAREITLESTTDFVCLSPDGALAACRRHGGVIAVVDVQSANLLYEVSEQVPNEHSAAFSPDNKLIAFSGTRGSVQIREAMTGEPAATISTDHINIHRVKFGPSGSTLATGAWEGPIELWDWRSGELKQKFVGHTGVVMGLDFSDDETSLASCSRDCTIRLWNVGTEKAVTTYSGHHGMVGAVAFLDKSTKVVSAGLDGTIKIWPTDPPARSVAFPGGAGSSSQRFTPDGTRFITAEVRPAVIRIVDLNSHSVLLESRIPEVAFVSSPVISPDGTMFAAIDSDRRLRIWDLETGNLRNEIEAGYSDQYSGVTFSPDSAWIAAPEKNDVVIFDVRLGNPSVRFVGHNGYVLSVSFSQDGSRVATSSKDATCRIWNAHTGEEQLCIDSSPQDAFMCWSASFSPDGKRLLTSISLPFENIKVWDADTGRLLTVCETHGAFPFQAAFSPDGKRIAVGYDDSLIKMFDTDSGDELVELSGHQAMVRSVSFSPNGNALLSVSADGTTRIWTASE